jgi:hypothetical protein
MSLPYYDASGNDTPVSVDLYMNIHPSKSEKNSSEASAQALKVRSASLALKVASPRSANTPSAELAARKTTRCDDGKSDTNTIANP